MFPQNNTGKVKGSNSAKKESNRSSPSEDKSLSYLSQAFQPSQESLTVTVIPCGREDGKNSEEEMPYELIIKKKVTEHSLKDIFSKKSEVWETVFKTHLDQEAIPNFSIFRRQFEYEQDPSKSELYLHILYMKSQEKSLARNYNAEQLELFCHNRFYGPLVVAYNFNKSPYHLYNFSLADLSNIENINRNFQNKSIKDDYVPECLLEFDPLKQDLDKLFKPENMERFTFYMFKYKSSWCPNKKDSHDSKSCIYAHHTRDFRRPPDIFKYSPEDCETLTKGIGWDKCEKGLKCNKCHTTVERLYHPDKYKRIYCDKTRCNNSDICAFNHSQKERQQALKECQKYRKGVDQKNHLSDINDLQRRLNEYYRNQNQMHSSYQNQSISLKSSLIEDQKEQHLSLRDSSSSSAKSIQCEEYKTHLFDSDNYSINVSPPQQYESNYANTLQLNNNLRMNPISSLLDQSSQAFQPGYRQNICQPPINIVTQQQQIYYNVQNQQQMNMINQPMQNQNYNIIQMNNSTQQQIMQTQSISQLNNMHHIQLIQNQQSLANNGCYFEEKIKDQNKLQVNLFEYGDFENPKTRTSTFSKASEGREEIKKNQVTFLDVFSNPHFLKPVDDEDQQSPAYLNRQQSGKSPSNFASPIILDFLEDDNFFQVDESRHKSKTEFVRRDRQESEDSNQDDFPLQRDAQEYLNSILPNNSIKFKKHSQSRFSFSNQKRK